MTVFPVDEENRLFISPAIDDWQPIQDHDISVVIDLDGELDIGIPTVPNHLLYIYFPIYDEELPNLDKLLAVARLGASLVKSGHKVLSHCGMGLNRSALVAGMILTQLGMNGAEAVCLLREKRPGALFNENFADFLHSIPKEGKA